MVTEQDIIKTANNLLHTRRYLEFCFEQFTPPEDVLETLSEMVEMYRKKGQEMIAECERSKQEEKDSVTFMEERGFE